METRNKILKVRRQIVLLEEHCAKLKAIDDSARSKEIRQAAINESSCLLAGPWKAKKDSPAAATFRRQRNELIIVCALLIPQFSEGGFDGMEANQDLIPTEYWQAIEAARKELRR